MIYEILDRFSFIKRFDEYNRQDNFTVSARSKLYDYYNEISEEWELDVIGICCDWAEYTENEIIKEFGDNADLYGEDATIENLIKYLESETTVIKLENDNYLVCSF